MKQADITIVGGGAAGLMAAVTAAKTLQKNKKNGKILLLEGNDRVGKKILATGNGRCNLSNETLKQGVYYGDRQKIKNIIDQCPADRVKEIFSEIGLLCASDEHGRIYPHNFQAAAVLSVLRRACEEYGVQCLCGSNVKSAAKEENSFVLTAENNVEIQTKKLILACGGRASPKHSCTDNPYMLAVQLGHSRTRVQPALVQILCEGKITKKLKGLRCKTNAALAVDGKITATQKGETIFADGSLSGICIFDLSAALAEIICSGKAKEPLKKHIEIILDLAPDIDKNSMLEYLRKMQKNLPSLPAVDILSGIINIRVGEEIVRGQIKNISQPIHLLKREQLMQIIDKVKKFTFKVTGTAGWNQAQVTYGGVPMEQCSGVMESQVCKGLYLAGEMLDAAGICGGYNLHFAWASGMAAGKDAAELR